jgi:hypothetical protein
MAARDGSGEEVTADAEEEEFEFEGVDPTGSVVESDIFHTWTNKLN